MKKLYSGIQGEQKMKTFSCTISQKTVKTSIGTVNHSTVAQ